MNKTVRIFIIVTVILSFFMVPSCSKPSKEGSAIEVGVILPLTGPIAMGGKRVLDGIKLAVEDFNSKNETKIELKIEDSQAQPSIGINAINKLIQIENVKFIIGDLISGVTLAIAPIAGC